MKPVRSILYAILIGLTCLGSANAETGDDRGLHVQVYDGEFPAVNSFIISDGESLLLMDVQRTSKAANELLDVVRSMKLSLTRIFITHGHTDHFMGLGIFRNTFPDAEIVVQTEEIKQDIKIYATWMNDGGWLESEPAMKPRSAENPDGFDYDGEIEVLSGNKLTLDGGGVLELTSDYKPNEGEHMTTAYSKDLNALFVSDFGYNNVHLWMGAGVTRQHIANWRAELLELEERYRNLDPMVYPGHGTTTDLGLFARNVEYIDNFLRAIAESQSSADALSRMVELYPDYRQADFLLKWSVDNHMNLKLKESKR